MLLFNRYEITVLFFGICFLLEGIVFPAEQPSEQASANSAAKQAYLDYALQHDGDPKRGEELFQKHDKLVCTNCHRITGMERNGPNLEGVADKYPRRELIRQVLFPSESIKPGFEQYTILGKDGRVHSGRLERANRTGYRLIDPKGEQTDFLTKDIESVTVSTVSSMPQNLEALLSQEEFADLIAYVATLKYTNRRGFVKGTREIEIPRLKKPVEFVPIHSPEQKFENPVWVGALPGTKSDLVVVEHQSSRIWRIIRDGDSLRKELFLDLQKETHISNNQGLMCVAFHPDYAKNRRYFLQHEVEEEGEVKSTIVERRAAADGLTDSGQHSIRLLEVVQPAYNHNGGNVIFGPDGMLYTAFGDGGPQKDPNGYSQNPNVFLGSMLRIDVDRKDPNLNYAIPPDNPFLNKTELVVRPETWAYGFREPWRFNFDFETGELYVGDVGQSAYEEVSLVRPGENHGWNVREGFAPFSDEYARPGEKYTDPIFVYEHGLGFSVTGGFVYRGKQNPSFVGVYIFGDYNTRKVWGLRQRDGVVQEVIELGTAPGTVASFGVDQRGELYLVTYMGTIYHVELSGTTMPKK